MKESKTLMLGQVCDLRDQVKFDGYRMTRQEQLMVCETAIHLVDEALGNAEIHGMIEDLCQELLSKKKKRL